jgi:hypothetical protein
MSKVSHFNFSLNTHFFVTNISSANPYFLVRHFYLLSHQKCFSACLITQCVTCFEFFLMYTLSCLNHIFLFPFSSCVSSITVSLAMLSTTSNISSQSPSVNGSQPNNPTKQHLSWSGNVSTLLPPCCQPLPPLAACCSLLATQRWCWPLPLNAWSVIRL